MKKTNAIQCPVSAEMMDGNIARAIAFFVMVFTLLIIYFHSIILAVVLAADFAVRAFAKGKYSLLKMLAAYTVQHLLHLTKKPVNAAPKKFAALLGFIFSTAIALFLLLHLFLSAAVFGILLISCAFLECVFNYCVGCTVYTCLIIPFKKQ